MTLTLFLFMVCAVIIGRFVADFFKVIFKVVFLSRCEKDRTHSNRKDCNDQ